MNVWDIETSRLRFRRFTLGNLHRLAEVRADADVMQYIGSGMPESLAEVQIILNKILGHWHEHGFGRWALIDRASNALIGWCGLWYLENTRDGRLGMESRSHAGEKDSPQKQRPPRPQQQRQSRRRAYFWAGRDENSQT
jgi:RimJ/RimL family protein N-acetyltransferase